MITVKTISADNYNIWVILLDISKYFDSVSRIRLFEYLEEILIPCELDIILFTSP